MSDLFNLDRVMTPQERRSLNRKGPQRKGYAAQPGSGPKDETCGSCKHHYRNELSRTYHKCSLMRAVWTGGQGTDILVRAPACRLWEAR